MKTDNVSAPEIQTKAASLKGSRKPLRVAVVLNWLNFAVYTGGAFLLTPIVLARLGAAGFGLWVLVQSISGYYGLINLGIGAALSRYVTRDLTLQDFSSLRATLSTVCAFFAITGLAVSVLAVTLRGPVVVLLTVPPSEAALFGFTMMVTVVGVVADFFAVVTNSLIGACEKYQISTTLSIARQFVYVTAVIAVLKVEPSFFAVACVASAIALLSLVVNTLVARRLVPEARLRWRDVSMVRLRELLGFGAGSALLTIANLVRLRLGNFVVARYSGVASVAGYSIASGLITNFSTIISSSTSMLGVRFTRLASSGNLQEMRSTYRKSLFVSSALAFGIGVHMLIYGEGFIRFWLRRDMPETVAILQILVVAYIFALAQSPSWGMMLAHAKHHFMARVTVIESILNVALGIYLAKYYGAWGFAIATAGTMLVTKLTIHPVYGARVGKLSLWEYLSPMVFPALFSSLLLLSAISFSWGERLRSLGFISFFFLGSLSFILYSTCVVISSRRKDYLPPFVTVWLKRVGLA